MCVCVRIPHILFSKGLMAINYKTIQFIMEILEWAAHRKCGCPIPGSVQSFEKPGLVKAGYARGRAEQVELDVL